MPQTSTNIIPKYRQETHYNYVGNSGFKRYSGSLHSPLLHYHYVSTSLTMQIPAETLSQTRRVCFMLLCYRFVSTTLTAQIPMETLSQSHRLCFMLLHYHYVSTSLTVQIPAETLSQTRRVCFMLLCYRKAYRTNS
jgi:hypothetical protein